MFEAAGGYFGAGGNKEPRTAPSFVDKGTAATLSTTKTVNFAFLPADLVLILHANALGQTVAATDPTGWTAIGTVQNYGTEKNVYAWRRNTRTTASESGSVTIPSLACTGGLAQVYAFQNVAAGSVYLEKLAVRLQTSNASLIGDAEVATRGTHRLAVNLIGFDDDNPTFGAFTGQSGGTWVNAAYDNTTAGTDSAIQLMTATLNPRSYIHAGSYDATPFLGNWANIGFALVGI